MSREFGGNTPLGAALNSATTQQNGTRIKRKQTKRGIIKDVVGRSRNSAEYIVIVDIYNADGKKEGRTRPIPLKEDPMFLAANYGAPEDLINRYWVEIEFEGPSVNRGSAKMTADQIRDVDIAGKSNELQIQGAAFAPPGSGLM